MSVVDYTAVAAGFTQAIPFNVHLGLQTITVAEDDGTVSLPDDQHLATMSAPCTRARCSPRARLPRERRSWAPSWTSWAR